MAIPKEYDLKKRDQLAGFHQTISKQLNARLAESPRFFWALVVVSTGYGYVLWNIANNQGQAKPGLCMMLGIASLLSYVAVLWASWYLAALGYAFRYLQNVQHCIGHALGWNIYEPKGDPRESGEPPQKIRRCSDIFWLLPSIYHAHVFGFVAFLAIIVFAFFYYGGRQWWGSSSALCIGLILFLIGVVFIICVNLHYVWKYEKKWKDPAKVPMLGGGEIGIPDRDTDPVPGANSQAPPTAP